MNWMRSFVAFIISHGRPDFVLTYSALRKHGYTGRIVIIIDDLDESKDKYFEKYGEDVVMFDKKASAKTFDIGDNFEGYRSTSYARNVAFDIASDLGYQHFVVLDDDYNDFRFRFNNEFRYIPQCKKIVNLDAVFSACLRFLSESGIHSVAFAQGGDFIGGEDCDFAQRVAAKRKCMNSFICSVARKFQFISRMNEDVNTYVKLGSLGYLFFTLNFISLNQMATQATKGGMTELYLLTGTYVKSFYSVMYMPSAVKVKTLNTANPRIHHAVQWNSAVPKIISEKHKK